MNELVAINNEPFRKWLGEKGYLQLDTGEITVPLRSAQALWYQEDIMIRKSAIEENFIEIAKDLWCVYKEGYWAELGYDNYTMFLSGPDVDLSKSVGYALKTMGSMLEDGTIDEIQALSIGTSKMQTLLPILTNEEDKEVKQEWLDRAEVLNNLDLMDEVAGKEINRYSGSGLLEELLDELRIESKEVFWNERVHLRIRTV